MTSFKNYRIVPGSYIDPHGFIHLPIFDNWNSRDHDINMVLNQFLSMSNKSCPIEVMHFPESHPPPLPVKENIINEMQKLKVTEKTPIKSTHDFEAVSNEQKVQSYSTPNDNFVKPELPPKPRVLVSANDTPNNSFKNMTVNKTSNDTASTSKSFMDEDNSLLDQHLHSNSNNHGGLIRELHSKLDWICREDNKYIKANYEQNKQSISSAITQFENLLNFESENLREVEAKVMLNQRKFKEQIKSLECYSDKIKQFEKTTNGIIIPSKLITANSPESNQLFELVSKDQAISDTIYSLSVLQNKKKITLEAFIAKTRELSRVQFLTRMHIQKILAHSP